MRYKFLAALFYATATLATANWLDYGLAEGYGGRALMYIAVGGSVLLGAGALAALFNIRYGVILGSIGLCFSWPYFLSIAVFLPWNQLVWFIRVQYHGADQMAAIVFLLAATIYSIKQHKYWKPSQT